MGGQHVREKNSRLLVAATSVAENSCQLQRNMLQLGPTGGNHSLTVKLYSLHSASANKLTGHIANQYP